MLRITLKEASPKSENSLMLEHSIKDLRFSQFHLIPLNLLPLSIFIYIIISQYHHPQSYSLQLLSIQDTVKYIQKLFEVL